MAVAWAETNRPIGHDMRTIGHRRPCGGSGRSGAQFIIRLPARVGGARMGRVPALGIYPYPVLNNKKPHWREPMGLDRFGCFGCGDYSPSMAMISSSSVGATSALIANFASAALR